MRELVKELFFLFSFETGILGMVKENQDFLGLLLLSLGIAAVFLGFEIYRMVFSLLAFMSVTILSVFLMRGITDWGSITTTFAVLGTVAGFFAYRWHKLGAVVICGLIGASIGWVYTYSIWFSLLLSVLSGVAVFYFPLIILCLLTSLWGLILIKDFHLGIPIVDNGGLIVLSIIFIVGFAIQMISNRNQSKFDEPYPEKFINWIREKGLIS